MNYEPLVYDVKPNESINEIAESIGMSTDELRDFHNANSEKMGLPWFYNFVAISKLIVPKNYKSPSQIWKEISEKLPAKTIHPEIFSKQYDVAETYEQIGEKNMKYDYKIGINLKQEKDFIKAEIILRDYITNDEKPDKKVSSLGLACMEAISPFSFDMSKEGEIFEIHDVQNLMKRFSIKRNEIEEFYTGQISKKYLDYFEEELEVEGNFKHQLNSTLLFQLVFHNLEQLSKKQKFIRHFYIVINSFPVKCEFEPEYEIEGNILKIKCKGVIQENCSLSNLLQNIREEEEEEEEEEESSLKGQINLTYYYDFNSKKLKEAEAQILLFNEEETYLKHQLKITQYEG